VEVQLKRGSYQNEMTKYRYDVRLEVGGVGEEGGSCKREEWEYGGESMEEIKRRVEQSEAEEVRVRGVMNRRVAGEVKAVKVLRSEEWEATAGELREVVQKWKVEALDPELFWSMTENLPYSVRVSWSSTGNEGSMDVFIKKTKQGNTEIIETASDRKDEPFMFNSWTEYANNPLEGFQRRVLIAELRNNLKQKLPEYMVPSAFVVMDSLPLTPSGKIDQDALPAPEHGRLEMEQAYIAPRSSLEEILTRIWEEVLGTTEIGIHDDFFELGGHSLVASHLISRLKETFQVELPLLSLYESSTIASLAQCIQAIRRVSEG
jgi:acyl carrier protein